MSRMPGCRYLFSRRKPRLQRRLHVRPGPV